MSHETEEASWQYAPLRLRYKDGTVRYYVCEEFLPERFTTGPCTPCGETVEELIEDLEAMAKHLRGALEAGCIIVEVDDWIRRGEDDSIDRR